MIVNNSHFAYLVDEGFTIDVFSYGTQFTDDQYFDQFTFIRIVKIERGSKVLFNWDDIKDSFTSFLESFIRRYNLSDTRLKLDFGVVPHGISGTTSLEVPQYKTSKKLSDIMEDRVKSDWPIKYISIKK